MGYSFNNEVPIYLQIIEVIKEQIIRKEFLPNDRLPSVREFSLMFEVNPNTVQKALNELEELGLIYTERTNGKFVTNNQELIDNIRKNVILEEVEGFYISMQKLGVKKQEVIKILNDKEWLWIF